MKQSQRKSDSQWKGWLLFFYSVPSRPVSNRMKIWRRLSKAGAVQIKGAVYILPMNDEHYEFFQWLLSEVEAMGGEAAFTSVASIDSIKDEEITSLFLKRLDGEYQAIGKAVDDIETRVNSIRKGSKAQNVKALSEQMAKLARNYEETRRKDFFSSTAGAALRGRIDDLNTTISGLAGARAEKKPTVVSSRKIEDYRGRTWVTREKPFIDRMASAWLIRRFIDSSGTFAFADEKDLAVVGKDHVRFDVSGGEFTHLGDLCTFEVLVKSFGIKDRTVKKIAEIVHDLDMKDGKYQPAEGEGLREILSGIRRTAKDDKDALEKGMSVFEMLYAAKK